MIARQSSNYKYNSSSERERLVRIEKAGENKMWLRMKAAADMMPNSHNICFLFFSIKVITPLRIFLEYSPKFHGN